MKLKSSPGVWMIVLSKFDQHVHQQVEIVKPARQEPLSTMQLHHRQQMFSCKLPHQGVAVPGSKRTNPRVERRGGPEAQASVAVCSLPLLGGGARLLIAVLACRDSVCL